jgi:ubiquinone/menaquinone biosynthesis C-methylase UbiE
MFTDPKLNLNQIDIQSGSKVADFGAGSGFYSLLSAVAVGDKGRVYAVDVQKDILGRIKKEAEQRGLSNVEVIWGDVEKKGGSHIKDSSLDLVIMSNILFQVKDKEAVLNEAKRVLKKGGRVLVVDWSQSMAGIGPSPNLLFPEFEAKNLFEKNGFILERRVSAGSHHYGLVFKLV